MADKQTLFPFLSIAIEKKAQEASGGFLKAL
jgi:hypothetical protein